MNKTQSATDQFTISKWFRSCLSIAAIFNLFGALSFAPPIYSQVADSLDLPTQVSPFGSWVLSTWIFIFGVGYAWLAFHPKPQTLFIAVAAACKIMLALLFLIFWLTGDLPLLPSLLAGAGDFGFAIAFIIWLFQVRS